MTVRKQTLSPNPLFERTYIELTDGWQFSRDNKTWQAIRVPFCPESTLSGIGYTDFIPICYYKTIFTADLNGRRIMLHFGAIDYQATVYINDRPVGTHSGGYTPFNFDVTDYLSAGENRLFIIVRDGEPGKSARGKQSSKRQSYGCFYTRTTGIWQPVWLEYVPSDHIEKFYFYPRTELCSVDIDLCVTGCGRFFVDIFYEGSLVGCVSDEIAYRRRINVPLSEKQLWECGVGRLYTVAIRYGDDEVHSYFGLREICYRGYEFLLNGKKIFQKLVMNQGYYPDGIYTASSIEAMQQDIDLSLRLGFNGARLHQKVFDPRFLYLCDRAGYMVWGEFPSWGFDYSNLDGIGPLLSELKEMIERDFNHPSIVLWCPLNEVWGSLDDPRQRRDVRFIDVVYNFTKILDPTRPCIDVSGGYHGHKTDVYDFHCYETPDRLKTYLDRLERDDVLDSPLLYDKADDLRYEKGMPVHISECGGIGLNHTTKNQGVEAVNEGAIQNESAWGYGEGETEGDIFVKRYKALAETLFQYSKISGFCYTQLYDIEQERNGFYKYDRSDKLTEAQKDGIRAVNDLCENDNEKTKRILSV